MLVVFTLSFSIKTILGDDVCLLTNSYINPALSFEAPRGPLKIIRNYLVRKEKLRGVTWLNFENFENKTHPRVPTSQLFTCLQWYTYENWMGWPYFSPYAESTRRGCQLQKYLNQKAVSKRYYDRKQFQVVRVDCIVWNFSFPWAEYKKDKYV